MCHTRARHATVLRGAQFILLCIQNTKPALRRNAGSRAVAQSNAGRSANPLPEAEPDFDFESEGALRFEIHFPRILPTSVISRFIVAMNEEAKNVWRFGLHGVMLGHAFKVTAHTKERVIRIAIACSGPARIRVHLRRGVHDHDVMLLLQPVQLRC